MPKFGDVIGIVEYDQALDDGAFEVGNLRAGRNKCKDLQSVRAMRADIGEAFWETFRTVIQPGKNDWSEDPLPMDWVRKAYLAVNPRRRERTSLSAHTEQSNDTAHRQSGC
jgi:hypothetical protein